MATVRTEISRRSDAFETGMAWGQSVTLLARARLLTRAPGTDSAWAFMRVLIDAEDGLPGDCQPFLIESWASMDGTWIEGFCEGVRAVWNRVEPD